jgi:hypothetical protein
VAGDPKPKELLIAHSDGAFEGTIYDPGTRHETVEAAVKSLKQWIAHNKKSEEERRAKLKEEKAAAAAAKP